MNLLKKFLEESGSLHLRLADIAVLNTRRVLDAFHREKVTESDLIGTTGYGYSDISREKVENIFARIFGGEAALVRPHLTSATHAIYVTLSGLLDSGDLMWFYGEPYDTLFPILFSDKPHSLKSKGVKVLIGQEFPTDEPKVVMFQRSGGYSWRSGYSLSVLAELIAQVRSRYPGSVIVVDNCYGEFVEEKEPGHIGADVVVGSLIKNPGGTLAQTGAYVVGSEWAIERIADFLFSPSLGLETGATFDFVRWVLHGLFLAPLLVAESVFSKAYLLWRFEHTGMVMKETFPYGDIIVRFKLKRPDMVRRFVQVIQSFGPVNAHFTPTPERLPGYDDLIVMAAPGFVQGASLELSADGRMAEPFHIFLQPGVSRYHTTIYADAIEEVLCGEESC